MAKTPETVFAFLDDLEAQLRPLGEAEKVKLLALKKEECEARGMAYEDELFLWDYRFVLPLLFSIAWLTRARRYYDRLWLEKNLALDDEKVKEYFPVNKVVPTILEIYRELLNVRFYKVPRTEEAGGLTWHEGPLSPLVIVRGRADAV